jgi:GxxExxY protein
MSESIPFAKEGYALMGAAFDLRSIPFEAKRRLAVNYKGAPLDTNYIPDFVVFDRIVVELKCVSAFCADHKAQLMNYMRICRFPLGYLINFAPSGKLDYRRVIVSDYL